MRLRAIALVSILVLWLAAACTPLTAEQIQEYARYAALRATEAAATEMAASVEATEAAVPSTPTPAAAVEVTTTVTVTATVELTATPTLEAEAPLTATVELTATPALAAEEPLTATVELAATPSLAEEEPLTPTVTATITPVEALETATLPPTPTPSPTAAATEAASPTPTSTPVPTLAATATLTTTPEAVLTWPSWDLAPQGAEEQAIPAPTPTPETVGTAVITSQQANIRGGPGLAFDIVSTASQEDQLNVIGRDEESTWWQVCCVDGRPAWVSDSIVRFEGDPEAVPVAGPLMPDDLEASWALRWECHAEGCPQEECLGQSQASTLQVRDLRWLEVSRQATWEDACGEDEDWLSQVDRYTGRQDLSSASAPLFNVWEGRDPGPANRVVDLMGRRMTLWCTETRTQEQEQGDGWTVVYEGQACYDTTSGILALLQYTKRWLFSGTYEGQTFDRQYFGDYEVYQQVLTGTNAPLSSEPLPTGPG
jgi:hypothetical protein